ncbi:MAG: ATP-binding protein [Candidatus Limnocylindria bacterium]
MTANELISLVTEGVFVLVFVVVSLQALRRPTRATIDAALLFGSVAGFFLLGTVTDALGIGDAQPFMTISIALIYALPYLLLRLVDDFSDPPRWLVIVAPLAYVGIVVLTALTRAPYPVWYDLLLVAWFTGLGTYVAVAFTREARRASGVTQRRMQAVAIGTLLIALAIVVAVAGLLAPSISAVGNSVTAMLGLGVALAYYIGFAPPPVLRRAWQEPELRAFLARAASLPRLDDTVSIVRELERGAAESTGAPSASIGLWDEPRRVLTYFLPDGTQLTSSEDAGLAGTAFQEGRPVFSTNAPRDDPDNAERYEAWGARAVIASRIGSGERKLGVLAVYGPQPPIFADDDIRLVQLLADQAAVILESRSLIDEAARVRAVEHATRLKDDFLSAAAHDLKTPLTALMAQAQLLELRVRRNPESPPPADTIAGIVSETRRLKDLVVSLLDSSRTEQGARLDARERAYLAELARRSCERWTSDRHPCVVEASDAVDGEYDVTRIGQLLDNLIENAVKYSPDGGEVTVKVWREDGEARISVIDRGIGIPHVALDQIFGRFQRAGNVDDRRFAGMGLGLFICQQVAREHGGRIWVTSTQGSGSTFHVALPISKTPVTEAPVSETTGTLSEVA